MYIQVYGVPWNQVGSRTKLTVPTEKQTIVGQYENRKMFMIAVAVNFVLYGGMWLLFIVSPPL